MISVGLYEDQGDYFHFCGSVTFNEFSFRRLLCEMLSENSIQEPEMGYSVRVYWDSYRSLFKVFHSFIPEFLVGRVLSDQLLLLL